MQPKVAEGGPNEADAASHAYEQAQALLGKGLLQDAIRAFDELKLRYPYSKYAPLAELRAADAYAKRDEHLTAIEGYRSFLRFHPSHPDAPYALEQIGEAYFSQIPRDFWPMPPGAEKDLDATRQAIDTYQDLLSRYGGATPLPQAQAHLDACRKKLGEHELLVARFYHRRGRWPGALGRAKTLLDSYPKLGFDAEALWLAGSALIALGQAEEGRQLLETLIHDHLGTRFVHRAQQLLAKQPKGLPNETRS